MLDEYFTIVKKVKDPVSGKTKVIPCGCATRDIAHSDARIPHASVQVIPVRTGSGRVIMHQRPIFNDLRTGKGKWDIIGGHVTFEMGIESKDGLKLVSFETAVKEACEEMLITFKNVAYFMKKRYFKQVGEVGQFECDEPRNVEYSTVFTLAIPENATIVTIFEKRNGKVIRLKQQEEDWDKLCAIFEMSKANPTFQGNFRPGFSDGIARILKQVSDSAETREQVKSAIDRCKSSLESDLESRIKVRRKEKKTVK